MPASLLDFYRPDRTRTCASAHADQLAVFYKDIDGCFVGTLHNDNLQLRPAPNAPDEAEYYLAPSGHCQHFPQRGLRKTARN